MVGGTIRGLGAGGHWGGGPELVAEADEYDRSFLHLRPEVAVITNIETDHLEYYGTAEAIYCGLRRVRPECKARWPARPLRRRPRPAACGAD